MRLFTRHKKDTELTLFPAFIQKHLKSLLLIFTMLTTMNAYSNPSFNSVRSGNVSISQSTHSTIVTQKSQKAIVQWNSFNIGVGEKTQFIQPNSHSVVLNRVIPLQGTPQSASQIYGSLTSNGQIILINGAGIHFGPNSTVNVGGLIASTTDISNANFLAGKYIFNIPSSASSDVVNNEGHIIAADHGLVALLGSNVANSGVIQARQGSIVLGAGSEFTLDFAGDQLVNFVVSKAASNGGTIQNSGKLLADGGQIFITAKAAQGVLDNVIDMGGVAQANSVSQKDGIIILSSSGNVTVSGKLIVSGSKHDSRGGRIKVLGQNVHLTSSATLNADGNMGGGEILVGGNAHGIGTEQNALTTTVDEGAVLSANALSQGNGGRVIVWSDNATRFHGAISATGGMINGDGGFVETSGHYLDVSNAKINLLASNGSTGTWLLDPADLIVCASCTTTASNVGGTFNTTGVNSYLLVSDLTSALNTANVTLQTTSSGTGGSGDIYINAAVNWTNASTLTLTAYNHIFLNSDIEALHGGLVLNAANARQSITSGTESSLSSTGVTANIAVDKFNLTQGQWYQESSSLPTFSAATDFELNSSSGSVQFIRALSGTGASSNPYLLKDIYGVQGINSNSDTLGFSYQLANNIDASTTSTWNNGEGFVPIGNQANNFTGVFNGQNYSINNYFSSQNGLFAITSSLATVENVGMHHATLSLSNMSQGSFGILVGINDGTVINSNSSGNVTNNDNNGSENIGGLVGQNNNAVSESYSNSLVSNNDMGNGAEILGGLVGQNNGTISTSYATGNVVNQNTRFGFEMFGGLVGQNNNPITLSYSLGNVTNTDSQGFETFGGFVGQNNVSISHSYNIGTVSNSDSGGFEIFGGFVGMNDNLIDASSTTTTVINNENGGGTENFGGLVGMNFASINSSQSNSVVSNNEKGNGSEIFGGLVGINFDSITSSYSRGSVINTDVNGSESLGGFVGTNQSIISDAYSTSSVKNNDITGLELLGGFVGINISGGNISNVYSTGSITNTGGATAGGLIGFNGGVFTNGFWDIDTSGMSNSSAGVGEHTSAMMLQNTYCPSGNCSGNNDYFDFANTWGIIPGDGSNPNGSYPFLLAIDSLPRVISGFIPGGNPSITGLSDNTVMLGIGGNTLDSTGTGSNGFYYFLEQNMADNTAFINYLSGSAVPANIVSMTPNHGASLTMLNMMSNNILVGGGTENLAGILTMDPVATISNTDLGSATTGLVTNDILFTASGNNITLNGVNTTLLSDSNTTYNINGSISSSAPGEALNFYGLVAVNTNSISTTGDQTYHNNVIVNTDTVINSQNGSLNVSNVNGNSAISLLANRGSITLNGNITTSSNAQNALILSDGNSFMNNAGSNALSAPNSRYLIYSINPANDQLDGLMPEDKYYHSSYALNNPSSLSDQTENTVVYTIAPVLTITANDITTPYDINPTFTYNVTGFVDGDTSLVLTGSPNYTLPDTLANLHVNGSPYAITLNGGGLTSQNNNYGFVFVSGNLTVTPVSLTVTAVGQNKVYDSTTNASVILSNNNLASDGLSLNYGSANFSDKNVGINKTITVNNISISGVNSADYALQNTSISTSANITPFVLTINAAAQNKVYDGTTNATASITGNSFVGDNLGLSYASASFSSQNAETAIPVVVNGIALTGVDANNYVLNSTVATSSANITPASLFVTANNQYITYGQTYSPTAVSYVGFVNGDSVNSLNAPSSVTATPSSDGQFHATNPGTSDGPPNNSPFAPYSLTPSAVTDPNYNITYVNGNLFVNPTSLNFNVPTGAHNITVNMSSGAPMTISGHSNLSTEQLKFLVDGTISSTTSFLTTDVSGATITSHATNSSLGTLLGLQINSTDTISHRMTLSQSAHAANADSVNVMTPDASLVPIIFGDPSTTLTLQGNSKNNVINLSSLDANFSGVLTANTKGGNSDIINFNSVSAAIPNTISLSASTINLNGDINLPNSTLNLTATSASLNPKSITSNNNMMGVTASINVNNFNLIQGGWYQVNSSLPTFTVGNNFQLNGIPNASVQFIRAASGTGNSANPLVLTDIYGIEGIGSNSTTLGYNYILNNNVNTAGTSHWNNGGGFIAIGNYTNKFTGSFNGQNYSINNLYINNSFASNPTALFGVTNNSVISNISVSGNFVGGNVVAALIGVAQNTSISSANVLAGSFVTSLNSGSVGGLVGLNVGGTLSNVSNSATVRGMASTSSIGGLMGSNLGGSVSQAINNGAVSDANGAYYNSIGGLIGVNTGTVNNSTNYGAVSAGANNMNVSVAGFVANNQGTILNSTNRGAVTLGNNSSNGYVAGFVAQNGSGNNGSGGRCSFREGDDDYDFDDGSVASYSGSITNAMNYGNVTVGNNSQQLYIGGLVGFNSGSLKNSINYGNVTNGKFNSNVRIGGVTGENRGTVMNSINKGIVSK